MGAGRARRRVRRSSSSSCSSSTISELSRLGSTERGIVDVGDAARHAGGEVAPGRAEHEDGAAGHVLTGVVAHALDDGGGTGVAHAEALADLAPDERRARGRPVENDVAGDDLLLGLETGTSPAAGRTMIPPERPLPR